VVDVGGIDAPFTVKVFDFDEDGGHDEIGEATYTLRECLFSWWSQALKADVPSFRLSSKEIG